MPAGQTGGEPVETGIELDDDGYAERIAGRLRGLSDQRTGLEDADPADVRRRLESTMYGGSRRLTAQPEA